MPDVRWGTVVGLGNDPGTLVVTDGIGTWVLPCMSSYLVRKAGDRVRLVKSPGGAWVVESAIRTEPLPDVVTQDSLDDQLQAVFERAVAQMTTTTISNGTTDPSGTGWKTGADYWRTTPAGDVELYIKQALPDTPPTNKPPAPPAKPKPVTIRSTEAMGWRGSESSDQPKAGSWTGGDWAGGWFFGNDIAAACAGKTVTKMVLSIARKDVDEDGRGHGINGGVKTRLALHDRATAAKTSTAAHRFTGPTLSLGERDEVTLPADERDALASGQFKGIACYGSGQSQYVIYTTSARLTITFG